MAALDQQKMLSIVEDAVASALRKGFDEAEAFAYQGFTKNVRIDRGQISRSATLIDQGVGMRTIVNKSVGFAYTNILGNEDTIDKTIDRAASTAKASKPDQEWRGLTEKKPFGSAEGTFDERIVNLRGEDLVEVASTLLKAAEKNDKRVFPIEGEVGASHICSAVANSSGVTSFDQGTVIECSLATIGQTGSRVTPVCFEFGLGRSYEIDPEWIGTEAARLAISALKPKRMESGTMQVIFTQFALEELLRPTLINAVKADSIQRNQSPLKEKIGQSVASENLTIHDDGLMKGGLRTAKFDGEGAPQRKTSVIEKGTLSGFLYDNYTARKEGKESSGNAVRAAYLSTPFIDTTNFHVMPGSSSPDELIHEVRKGLVVYYLQGAHSSNPMSGDFCVVATPAWKINHGEISESTDAVMLTGNIFQLLNDISALGTNERKFGQLVSPWILVESVRVIGK